MTALVFEALPHYDPAWGLPSYANPGDSGFDLRAAVAAPVPLAFGRQAVVPTGLRFILPAGHELQVRPRSGLAAKAGVTVVNAPGTVDEGYRGEVMVILACLNQDGYVLQPGERIAQAVLAPVLRAGLVPGAVDADTARGAAGFGSTGTR